MVDLKAVMLLTASIILTGLVVAASFGAMVSSVSAETPQVMTAGGHAVIIVPLEVRGNLRISQIKVNGETLSVTNIELPGGKLYLVIESLDSVKVFRSMSDAIAYINANKVFIPGRPILPSKSYHIRIVFSDGSAVDLTLP